LDWLRKLKILEKYREIEKEKKKKAFLEIQKEKKKQNKFL